MLKIGTGKVRVQSYFYPIILSPSLSLQKTKKKRVGFLHPSSSEGSKLVAIKEMITAVGSNSAGEEGTQG